LATFDKRRNKVTIKVSGIITRKDTGLGVAGLLVEAWDADLLMDNILGTARTDNHGRYAIACPDSAGIWDQPDLYVRVKSSESAVLGSTRNRILYDVTGDVALDLSIDPKRLAHGGARDEFESAGHDSEPVSMPLDLRTWTFRAGKDSSARLTKIRDDLTQRESILDLFHHYKTILDRSADAHDPVYSNLDELFDAGQTPATMRGHFYGITLGVRCGADDGHLQDYANGIGVIWGATLSDECPWVGKSLSPIDEDALRGLTGGAAGPSEDHLLGINHFNSIHTRVLNPLAFQFLDTWMDLHPAPQEERRRYGWEKNGAYFIGSRARSVVPELDRPVFQLNYRYKALGNKVPNCWLIDELVQVAEGLYLGQLCYATRKLLHAYNPQRLNQDYRYANFGYFLLLDKTWHAEARRLFPYLDIPPNAPGMIAALAPDNIRPAKFSTFTFTPSPPSACSNAVISRVEEEAGRHTTILHYLKQCAETLQDNLSNHSPYFTHLHEIFMRGIAPQSMQGFYSGALISWRSAGLFEVFGLNTINLVYNRLAAPFSTWVGKCFDPISPERLNQITGGHETGEVPTFWGANCQALRSLKERFVGKLMKVANIWTEPASIREAQTHGYDVKNFFYIARQADAIGLNKDEKQVFQLNYRWPKLKTMIPDCYCIDEVVQIADGLFLGRLMYATNLKEAYNPEQDPSVYRYELFGYFLLMDDEWQQIRLRIGFDLHNA
jgi:hypothetical protein